MMSGPGEELVDEGEEFVDEAPPHDVINKSANKEESSRTTSH
jgi:hypothetical protein